MEKALKDAITICKTLLRNGYDAHVINAPVQEHLLKHSKQLAVDIDQFYSDYDPYEYKDRVDDREDALTELTAMLRSEAASDVRNWLQEFADENESGEAFDKATELLERLNQLVPEAETKHLRHWSTTPCATQLRGSSLAAESWTTNSCSL